MPATEVLPHHSKRQVCQLEGRAHLVDRLGAVHAGTRISCPGDRSRRGPTCSDCHDLETWPRTARCAWPRAARLASTVARRRTNRTQRSPTRAIHRSRPPGWLVITVERRPYRSSMISFRSRRSRGPPSASPQSSRMSTSALASDHDAAILVITIGRHTQQINERLEQGPYDSGPTDTTTWRTLSHQTRRVRLRLTIPAETSGPRNVSGRDPIPRPLAMQRAMSPRSLGDAGLCVLPPPGGGRSVVVALEDGGKCRLGLVPDAASDLADGHGGIHP